MNQARQLAGCRIAMLVVMLLLAGGAAAAHPGIGIVMDSKGNVFYTDLKQVWKITPDGKKSVAVPNVHTHELCLDAQDNLYGEHLWYEGERIDKWGHYVWRLSADGKLERIIGPREGFLSGYSFVRDAAGNLYWADRPASSSQPTHIRKRAPDGKITDLVASQFNNVRWMTAAPDGTVYLVDFRGGVESHLIRITPDGKITTLTKDLAEGRFSVFSLNDQHAVMGLAPDKDGNVYLAVMGNRVVKKVTPAGRASVVARSPAPWSPTGVLPARDGSLWILETSVANTVRVRRIRPDGSAMIF